MFFVRILLRILYVILAIVSFVINIAAALGGVVGRIISVLLLMLSGLCLFLSFISPGGAFLYLSAISFVSSLGMLFIPMLAEKIAELISDGTEAVKDKADDLFYDDDYSSESLDRGVVIDFFAITALSIYLLSFAIFDIHVVFSFLIGAATVMLSYWLTRFRVTGIIIQAMLGLAWIAGIYYVLENNISLKSGIGFMTNFRETQAVWYWAALALASILSVGLHLKIAVDCIRERRTGHTYSSYVEADSFVDEPCNITQEVFDSICHFNSIRDNYYQNYSETRSTIENIMNSKVYANVSSDNLEETISDAENFLKYSQMESNIILNRYMADSIAIKQEVVENNFERFLNDTKTLEFLCGELHSYIASLKSAYEDALRFYSDNIGNNANSQAEKNDSISFFKGCDTLEKLNKRYKSLAKAYHPDMEAGDTEMMQIINNEYERLKSELGS